MVVASRRIRQEYAERAIWANPKWTRDDINESLRKRFGVGLRKQYVDDLKNRVLWRKARVETAERRSREITPITRPAVKPRRRRKVVVSWERDLIDAGFLKEEGRELKGVPADVPYMQAMFRERFNAYLDAKQQGLSDAQWAIQVKDFYFFRFGDYSPATIWENLRTWEDRYREKYPEYETPERKRKRKTPQDFDRKYDEGGKRHRRTALEKYEQARGR